MVNRRVLWAVGVAAISAVLVWHALPSRWTLSNRAGRVCTVRQGATRRDVLAFCGDPDAEGGQTKRGYGFLNMCSAPCDRYGERLAFYDCEGRLSEVEREHGYQGCVIAQ